MLLGRRNYVTGFVSAEIAARSYQSVVRKACQDRQVSFPKIELHVHLEGTVRPAAILQIARRNGVTLPADSVQVR
jgi:hypothetical protein